MRRRGRQEPRLLDDLDIGLHRERDGADQGCAGGPAEAVAKVDQVFGGRFAFEDIAAKLAAKPLGFGKSRAVVGPETLAIDAGPG